MVIRKGNKEIKNAMDIDRVPVVYRDIKNKYGFSRTTSLFSA